MPELPEARTIARRLNAAAVGCTIRAVRLVRPDMLKTGSPRTLAGFVGQRFERVDTRGKYVVAHTPDRRLVIQLGMAGRIRLTRSADPLAPHTHLVIHLARGRDLRYSNVRRIAGGLHVLPAGSEDLGPMASLGPEVTDVALEAFVAALRRRRRPVKAALLDQSLLAGLGNIYSDEALGRAGVRPTRRACRLRAVELARLHRAIAEVLTEAIAAGGSTLADANPFVDADGDPGYFTLRHRVYGRAGRPCLQCGAVLKRTIVAGRTTTFCPRCQR